MMESQSNNGLYTDAFMQLANQSVPAGNVSYNQTEGTFEWTMVRPEVEQAMREGVRDQIGDAVHYPHQELTQEHIREVFTELFYNRIRERERQIRVWPNRIAEYPMTPQEAFSIPWDRTRFSNEPFSSVSGTVHEAVQEHVRQYIEREDDHILRLHDPSLLQEMLTYSPRQDPNILGEIVVQSRRYGKTMRQIEALVKQETALQKETNKASPYLDFDNY